MSPRILLVTGSRALATQDADDERAREHMADLVRTRITPGADPRAEWQKGRGAGFETGKRTQPRGIMLLDASSRSDAYRYVPDDVRRWRDPKHRAALTARARAHAALVPGCRAAMEAER